MKINAFDIYEFGILSKQNLKDIPSGLLIFLGQNEAGKSTSLEFFRTLLTGFPSSRSKKAKEGVFSQKNPNMGGILELLTASDDILKLERTTNKFQIYNSQGAALPQALYETLLAGTNRDIYSSLYGFSLSELQTIDTLENEDIRNVLYGTSFGLGLYSPQKALTQIHTIMNSKGAGKDSYKNLFKSNCQRIEEINKLIKENKEQNNEIDSYFQEFTNKSRELKDLRTKKAQAQEQIFFLDTKIHAWEQYKEWHVTQQEIQRIPHISDAFPQKGSETLHNLQNSLALITKNAQVLEKKRNQFSESLATKENNTQLIELLPELQDLLAYRASYRNALLQLASIQANLSRSEEDFKRHLNLLGKNWTIERAQEIDCSLFVHERIEEYRKKFTKTEQDIQQSQLKIDRLTQEKQLTESEIKTLSHNHDTLSDITIELDMTNRNILSTALRRAQDAQSKIIEKERFLSVTQSDYKRSLNQLGFRKDPTQEALSDLIDMQDKVIKLAHETTQQASKTLETNSVYTQKNKELEQLKDYSESLTAETKQLLRLEKGSLNKKKAHLNRIYYLLNIYESDMENLGDLEQQYEDLRAEIPITRMNMLFLVSGVFSLIIGSILLITYFIFGIHEIDTSFIPENKVLIETFPFLSIVAPSYHIQSTIAFLLFLFGFTGIYQNIPTISPYKRKKALDLGQAGSRYETALSKVTKNQKELSELCELFDISEVNSETLELLEQNLEDEQEQLIKKETLLKETHNIEKKLIKAEEELQQAFEKHSKEEKALQKLRLQWQETFNDLKIIDVPTPESVTTYFARVEHVGLIQQNIANIQLELEELKDIEMKLIHLVEEHFPDFNNDYSNLENIFIKVQNTLDLCQVADKQAERRLHLKQSLYTLESKKENIISSMTEEEKLFSKYSSELENIQNKWQEYLQQQKLENHLSPLTAKIALAQVEKCLEAKALVERLKEEKAIQEAEKDKLILPIQKIIEILRYVPAINELKNVDYLKTLDNLYRDAIKAKETFNATLNISEQLEQTEEEIKQTQQDTNELNSEIQNILHSVGLTTEEEFEIQASHLEELRSLQKKKQNLEDTLQFLARDKSLKEFMQEFEGLELPIMQYQKTQLEEELQKYQQDEENLNTEIAERKAKMQYLESSNTLTELQEEKVSLEEENIQALQEYLTYALAHSFIQQAKQNYEKEKQPELIKIASEIFSRITDNKWINITSSMEDNTLYLNPKQGVPITPDKLSQGTREQLYLSLRLAYIKNAEKYKEPLPLIMDDILVNFDATRANQTAKAFAEFTDNNSHQILFFTCHAHIAEILQKNVTNSKLYTINNGHISE